jgi:hypothetical protein
MTASTLPSWKKAADRLATSSPRARGGTTLCMGEIH